MSDEKLKKSIVLQGSILAGAGLISKVIGFVYRIPMANVIGNTGNGLYSVAFGIYNIALTLSSYSMPLAISKLMSARLAKKEFKNAHRMFADALAFAMIAGLCAALVLFFGAGAFAGLYHKQGLEAPLRVLAPTVFVVALLGSCRGYYQGHRNMLPTALSQVLEQVVNAVVSVVAASALVKAATEHPEDAVYDSPAAAGAAGGTLGTLAGAAAALLFFALLFFFDREKRLKEKSGEDTHDESHALIMKALLLTVLPVILSQTVYQIGYTTDDLLFGNLMVLKGFSEQDVTSLQGVFNTQYNQMINLPVAIATAMAAATLPSIVVSHTRGEREKVKEKTNTVLKINMLIAFPSAVGLAVLAEPIMGVLFPRLGEYLPVAVMLLRTGSAAVVFYALSTLTNSILQGCDRMRLPVIHSAAALVIHILLVAFCIRYTSLGVYSLVIGNVTFPLCVSIMNGFSIRKLLGYRFQWSRSFIKPLIASLIMGAVARGVYTGILRWNDGLSEKLGMLIAMMSAIFIGALSYFVLLSFLRVLTRDELRQIPVVKRWYS